ncbi:MAG: DUF4296 domain-containing protein [Muribaculaceae bacterium]|nr:DUF4296 domain-containing protein [Muribaculaceae bacterium]
MSLKPLAIIALTLTIVLTGCDSRPKGVLSQSRMIDLMTDVQKGEAYVDAYYQDFPTDSTKMVLRQSVLKKHGVTSEQFDSSLMWYGIHSDEYAEVYAEVIERLEAEMNNLDPSENEFTSFAGDSVNTWTESPYYVISETSPSNLLKFSQDADENWFSGDSYTWQFKTLNQHDSGSMAIYLDYDDGTTEMISQEFDREGWQRLTIVADSLRNPVNIYGVTQFNVRSGESLFVDSVSLVRKRLNPMHYRNRFRQRHFNYGK